MCNFKNFILTEIFISTFQVTNLQNSQDLAPNYAGTLYGIINFVGTTSGFISPLIVAHFTAEQVSEPIQSEIIKDAQSNASRAQWMSGNTCSASAPWFTSSRPSSSSFSEAAKCRSGMKGKTRQMWHKRLDHVCETSRIGLCTTRRLGIVRMFRHIVSKRVS